MRWVVGLPLAGFVLVGLLWPEALPWLDFALRVGRPAVVLGAARAA
jgi:hypothetical protein